MKEEERRTSFLGCFDDDEKKAAEILRQFPELVIKYESNRGILPFWSPKALRSVLVNIPLPSRPRPLPSLSTLPCTESRPLSNGLPSIPESLPSSSKAHSANARLHPKKNFSKISLMVNPVFLDSPIYPCFPMNARLLVCDVIFFISMFNL